MERLASQLSELEVWVESEFPNVSGNIDQGGIIVSAAQEGRDSLVEAHGVNSKHFE